MADINRGSGFALPKEVASEVLSNAQEASAVMNLAQRTDLPGGGKSFPVLTDDPEASWVAETNKKPVDNGGLSTKNMTAYKLAVITTVSMEFARDLNALYGELVNRLPGVLAKKFDETVLNGTAPGSGFDVLTGAPEVEYAADGLYGGFVEVLTSVGAAGGDVDGWVLSPAAKGQILSAVDGNGRPLNVSGIDSDGVRSIFGAQALYTRRNLGDAIAVAGDWSSARWGTVEGVQIATSEHATVGVINTFEQNMLAVRAEIEVGFVASDVNKFARLVPAA